MAKTSVFWNESETRGYVFSVSFLELNTPCIFGWSKFSNQRHNWWL